MPKAGTMQQLQDAIGEDACHILKQRFAGKLIYIPKNPDDRFSDKTERNRNIKCDFHQGMDVADLQEKYGLSKSRIHHILGMKQDIF